MAFVRTHTQVSVNCGPEFPDMAVHCNIWSSSESKKLVSAVATRNLNTDHTTTCTELLTQANWACSSQEHAVGSNNWDAPLLVDAPPLPSSLRDASTALLPSGRTPPRVGDVDAVSVLSLSLPLLLSLAADVSLDAGGGGGRALVNSLQANGKRDAAPS